MAAVLACGLTAALSHRDAAAHWGIRRSARRAIDVTVARRQVFLCIVTDAPDAAELRVIHPKDARRDRFA